MTAKFEFQWLVEDLVCRVVLPDNFKDDVLDEYDQMMSDILDQAAHKIHLVVDLRSVKNAPSLNQARKLRHLLHPNIGRILIVGMQTNLITRFIVSLVAQTAGLSYKSFDNSEEAFAYLRQMEDIQVSSQK